MSIKESEKEISRLKNALKLQQRSFKQSDAIIRTLKDGLLQQERWRKELLNNPVNAKHVAAYFSQYNTRRENDIHLSQSVTSGLPLPSVPKLGLLTLPSMRGQNS